MDIHALAGQAVSLLARERRPELAELERGVPTVSCAAYLARRNALLCGALRWGLARLRAEVELTRAQGSLDAAELATSLAHALKRRKAGPVESSARDAARAARKSKHSTLANVAGLEIALHELAGRFHFDADAVREMVGLPRIEGNAVPNEETRQLAETLITNFIADLETQEAPT